MSQAQQGKKSTVRQPRAYRHYLLCAVYTISYNSPNYGRIEPISQPASVFFFVTYFLIVSEIKVVIILICRPAALFEMAILPKRVICMLRPLCNCYYYDGNYSIAVASLSWIARIVVWLLCGKLSSWRLVTLMMA